MFASCFNEIGGDCSSTYRTLLNSSKDKQVDNIKKIGDQKEGLKMDSLSHCNNLSAVFQSSKSIKQFDIKQIEIQIIDNFQKWISRIENLELVDKVKECIKVIISKNCRKSLNLNNGENPLYSLTHQLNDIKKNGIHLNAEESKILKETIEEFNCKAERFIQNIIEDICSREKLNQSSLNFQVGMQMKDKNLVDVRGRGTMIMCEEITLQGIAKALKRTD